MFEITMSLFIRMFRYEFIYEKTFRKLFFVIIMCRGNREFENFVLEKKMD